MQWNEELYTGQQQEVEIGLSYYIARFYDPAIAHFIQPDSIIPQASASASYDRYAYVNNNPINFNDPSGHAIKIDDGGSCVGYWECLRNIPIIQSKPKVTIPTGFFPNNPIISTQWTKETIIPVTPTPKPPLVQIGPVEGNFTNSTSRATEPWKFPYKIVIDKTNIDWVDITIDGLGLAGDVALIFAEPGPGIFIDAAVSIVELIGATKTMNEVIRKDYSGVNSFTTSMFFDMAGKNPILIARFGRVAPLFGSLGNLYSLYDNINPQIKKIPTE